MWVFLATEVMFFGTLFVGLGGYRYLYPQAFEAASARAELDHRRRSIRLCCWSAVFGLCMAVHHARCGNRQQTVNVPRPHGHRSVWCFWASRGWNTTLDFRDNLVPRLSFDPQEWVSKHHLVPTQVPQVELFLLFYWIMTAFHGLHVTIGVAAVLIIAALCWKRNFTGGVLCPGRRAAPVLALCRYRMDFPAAHAVFIGHPPSR